MLAGLFACSGADTATQLQQLTSIKTGCSLQAAGSLRYNGAQGLITCSRWGPAETQDASLLGSIPKALHGPETMSTAHSICYMSAVPSDRVFWRTLEKNTMMQVSRTAGQTCHEIFTNKRQPVQAAAYGHTVFARGRVCSKVGVGP